MNWALVCMCKPGMRNMQVRAEIWKWKWAASQGLRAESSRPRTAHHHH